MPAEQFLHRKERLLISAIRLLDEGGLAGVTTREMARREGISEPAVYRHFNGKTDILMAILEQFSAFDVNLENTVRENSMNPLDAIRHLCRAYAGHYSGYPEIANVMFSLDLWKYDAQLQHKYESIIMTRYRLMRDLVDHCASLRLLRPDVKPEVLSDLLSNLVISTTRQWRLEGMSYSLAERMEDVLDLILTGAGPDKSFIEQAGGND